MITNARVTVTRKIQLKSLIAHACNPIVPFRIERREPRFCREILQTLLPRSGDVIHPLLWRGSGYETNTLVNFFRYCFPCIFLGMNILE